MRTDSDKMDKISDRLAGCFSAVFTKLTPEEIAHASAASVDSWDSLSIVTLFAVIEAEFGITIEDKDSARFDSFANILAYLQEASRQGQIRGNGDLE